MLGEDPLQPGDQVLSFTDGAIEARSADDEPFGGDRLADLVARQGAAGQPAAETLRRLVHAVPAHQAGALQDDATTMLLERQGGADRGRGREDGQLFGRACTSQAAES